MYILGYAIIAFAKVFGLIINLYTIIVVIAALISWVNPDPYNPIVRILYGLTRPVFNLVRRCFPAALLKLRIDLSPLVVLLILVIVETLVVGSLLGVGRSMVVSS
jgi:YggT family protein